MCSSDLGDLELAHCNDPDCAGDNEIPVTVDSRGIVGRYTSLVLDGSGNPVVSYYDATSGDLKLAHCNDPNCAGDNEIPVTVDSGGIVGRYTSLVSDGSCNPVASYTDATNGDLNPAHSNHPNRNRPRIPTAPSDGETRRAPSRDGV